MSHADRPPRGRTPRPWRVLVRVLALVVVVLVVGVWAGSSLKDSDDAASAASAKGGSGLTKGVKIWDDMSRVRGLTVSTGERLQSSVRELSDDIGVQEATLAVAWKATCAVLFDDVPLQLGSIAEFVLDLSAEFGITFLEEGEQVVASAVLDAIHENANDAAAKCSGLRDAGF
jgi:hypothetical protein